MSDSDTPVAPAPWLLRGNAWVTALSMPAQELDREDFLPPALRGQRHPGRVALLMYVEYLRSDVGPYHELLFIPGRFRFPDGHLYPSISRIFVSTTGSVVNGQRNWGIPKERADFQVEQHGPRVRTVSVSHQGRMLARLTLRHYPLPFPAPAGLLPERLRTLGQHRDHQTFLYAPSTRALVCPARLLEARADAGLFPDIGQGKPLFSVFLSRFRMTFPAARVMGDPV